MGGCWEAARFERSASGASTPIASRHPAIRARAFAIGLSALLLGCSQIPDPPAPLALAIPHPVDSTRSLPTSGGPGSQERSTDISRFLGAHPPPPALPLPEPRIEWWPARPRQASAVGIRIRGPAGPDLHDVRVRLAGSEVRLSRDSTGWVGVGALPLDSAGLFQLELGYRRLGSGDRRDASRFRRPAPGGLRSARESRQRQPESRTIFIPVEPRTFPSTRIGISAGDRSDPEVDARIAREQGIIRAALLASGEIWLPDAAFRWPRNPPIKTSPFGQRRVFSGSVRSRHMGLDLRARRGAPIMAPAAGRVLLAGNFFYQGNAVYLDHGLGLVTAYFHMTRLEVAEGDLVRAGQVLGRSGSTGRSSAAHLHWSAYVNGVSVDPESLFDFWLSAGTAVPATPEPTDETRPIPGRRPILNGATR